MSINSEEYKSYLAELEYDALKDIETNINREKYPEKYQCVINELSHRINPDEFKGKKYKQPSKFFNYTPILYIGTLNIYVIKFSSDNALNTSHFQGNH